MVKKRDHFYPIVYLVLWRKIFMVLHRLSRNLIRFSSSGVYRVRYVKGGSIVNIMDLFNEINVQDEYQRVFEVQSFNYEHGRFVGFVTRRGKTESVVIAIPEGGLVPQESIANKTGEGFDPSNTKLKVLNVPKDLYMTFITIYFGMKIKSVDGLVDVFVDAKVKNNTVERSLRTRSGNLKVSDCSIPVAVMESKSDWEFWEHTNKEEVLKYLKMM
nr:hypothetical protein [uncultured bacterium]